MPSDFGDDAGEKMFDWMMRIGQEMGADAARNAADGFTACLKDIRQNLTSARLLGDDEPEAVQSLTAVIDGERSGGRTWAKLDVSGIDALEGSEEFKTLMSDKLSSAQIEHVFFKDEDAQQSFLLFKVKDAPVMVKAFEELEADVSKAQAKVVEQLGRGKDDRPLEERAQQARDASKALEADRAGVRDVERDTRPVKTTGEMQR